MKKRDKYFLFALALLLLGSILLYFYITNNRTNDKKIKNIEIGSILPLSNKNYASYAKQLEKGMDLAEEIINRDSLVKFKIIKEDGFGEPYKSISAMNKLIDIDKVNFIIGPMFSNVAESMAPISKQKQIILLSPTASSIKLSMAGKYFFRIYPSDSYDGKFLANFINKKFGNETVAIIGENASSIKQIIEVFKNNLANKIIFEQTITNDNLNNTLSSIVLNLKQKNPDIVFFPGNKNFMTTFLKKCKEINLTSKFITISTFNDKEIIELTGDASEGVLFSTPYFDLNLDTPEMKKFKLQYQKKYKTEPDILAGYGYDVVNISYEATKESMNTDSIIKKLHQIKNYPGVTGNISFDKNGDVIKQLQMMIVKRGKFEKYE